MFGYSKKLILKSREFKRELPADVATGDTNHFNINLKYLCPDLYVHTFKHIYFLPDSTLFLFRIWPVSLSFLYYKKRIKHHSIKGIFDIQRTWKRFTFEKVDNKPYLIIHDAWTLNYYHWMTQALPRLLLALKAETSFTLLLPKDHCKEFHIKSLKTLGINDWINFDVDKTYYEVRNLMYPSHDIQIGDYHDGLMDELTSKLRLGIETKEDHNYVFIHRTSTGGRRIINEEQVLSAFLSWGFTLVNFENLSFEEQRKVAGKASILAGVHGAGLTNMLFMEKGSRVLELTTVLNGEQYYYYTLSNALGHAYYYQSCKPDEEGKPIQEANLLVDIELLNRNIEIMVTHGND